MASSRRTIREWVARKLGRLHSVAVTYSGSGVLYDVPLLGDLVEDEERFIDSYLMLVDLTSTMPQWRRITATNIDIATPQISVNRVFSPQPTAGQSAFIYQLLTPVEWNDAINEALTRLHFVDRETIEMTEVATGSNAGATQHEYALPTWIVSKGAVLGVKYRNVATGREQAVGSWRINERLGAMTLVLIGQPPSITNFDIIVEANRMHGRLDEDAWGTTCPLPLWQSAVEVAAIHKIYKKYGPRFKQQYAQDLAIAEREFLQMRAEMLPRLVATEYRHDEEWEGPDIDSFFLTSGWA